MLALQKIDKELMLDIYPEYSKIDEPILISGKCSIQNIAQNSKNDYEVYANYTVGSKNYPLFLLIVEKKNKLIITASRGIYYGLYDKTVDYAVKKGCVSGTEYDVILSNIIKEKNILDEFEAEINKEGNTLHMELLVDTNNLQYNYGYVQGDIYYTNKSNYDYISENLNATISFFDDEQYFLQKIELKFNEGLKANSTTTIHIFQPLEYKFSIIKSKVVFNNTTSLRKQIKDKIITNKINYCK